MTDIGVSQRPTDIEEETACQTFFNQGCGCQARCSEQFPELHYRAIRNDMAELSKQEMDLVIMGQLLATTRAGDSTSALRHPSKERDHSYTQFMHNGVKV